MLSNEAFNTFFIPAKVGLNNGVS